MLKVQPKVSILRCTTFRHSDLSTATLEMRTNGERWSVARYLPAGMDIGPDHVTWRDLDKAERHYASQLEYIQTHGFIIVADTNDMRGVL